MRIITLLVLGILIWSCTSDQNTATSNSLETLEQAYASDASDANASALSSAYETALGSITDGEKRASLSQKAAQLALDRNQVLPAIATLTAALRNNFGAANSADNAFLLANAYEQVSQKDVANTVYQAFLQAFPTNAKVGEIKDKLGNLPALNVRMDTIHGQVYNDSLQQLDYKKAQDYITCSELHSTMLSTSENSPVFLQKAAEIARALRNYPKALELYEEVLQKYPKSAQAEQALFLSAFTLDNDMKKLDDARAKYEAFLDQYPKSDFADDTQFLLSNLGKDEEEIIEMLQNK